MAGRFVSWLWFGRRSDDGFAALRNGSVRRLADKSGVRRRDRLRVRILLDVAGGGENRVIHELNQKQHASLFPLQGDALKSWYS